eukprot:364837-Chlamydomonas_euryale.AAC.7
MSLHSGGVEWWRHLCCKGTKERPRKRSSWPLSGPQPQTVNPSLQGGKRCFYPCSVEITDKVLPTAGITFIRLSDGYLKGYPMVQKQQRMCLVSTWNASVWYDASPKRAQKEPFAPSGVPAVHG